ncbi:hypothetical protein M422DRAFT_266358 [Sphaerobolus stellatus SS14]|uniref:Fungal lipase-like domain-containing protein n=1 Tax=Sphaerobolus stellatus (strain SS14) TaxID=990650 RepID=A0A0C9V2Z7_SPHS4|nr:hypothetical protein M422DRAFT_266358 [Sphaerobolus stellatus SS14]
MGRAAPSVLAATRTTLSAHPGASAALVGHSLGSALSLIDALYLPLHFPAGTKFKFVGYANLPNLTRITNMDDPVPILPGRFLGFQHTHGEVHITSDGVWRACAGNDNANSLCTVRDVKNLFEGNTGDHNGPYNGVMI